MSRNQGNRRSGFPIRSGPGGHGRLSNRRKELKFAATDLKLFRRQNLTAINHWDVWRAETTSKGLLSLGCPTGSQRPKIEKLVWEAQALVKTYLEGAGIVAWREDSGHYVSIPLKERISTVDDVLYRIASEITRISPPGKEPPPAEIPTSEHSDIDNLTPDSNRD